MLKSFNRIVIVLTIALAATFFFISSLAAKTHAAPAVAPTASRVQTKTAAAPGWLEPRGISVVELVGHIPEDILQDLIIHYEPGNGIMRYIAGARVGNTVSLTATVEFAGGAIPCLGWQGEHDTWNIVVPAGSMRVFANGSDITDDVQGTYTLFEPGLLQPINSASGGWRYPSSTESTVWNGDGSIAVPANSGCKYTVSPVPSGNITVSFEFTNNLSYISVEKRYEKTIDMRSYIGPGETGRYAGLMSQMIDYHQQQTGDTIRHDHWQWPYWPENEALKQTLEASNYYLAKFPPMQDGPFSSEPNSRPGSGTYRQMKADGGYQGHIAELSNDHNYGMLIPLHILWQDADWPGSSDFLPTHDFFVKRPEFWYEFDELKGPEYVVTPDTPWQSCMANNTPPCPQSLIEQVYNDSYDVEFFFFTVERTVGGLTQVPLKQVGNSYSPRRDHVLAPMPEAAPQTEAAQPSDVDYFVYVPIVFKPLAPPDPVNNGMDCPCGWFDDIGRMWDIVEE